MNSISKDPVCGMTVLSERGLTTLYQDRQIFFCSEYCRNRFLERPERYIAALVTQAQDDAKENRRIAYFSMEVAVPEYAHLLWRTRSAGRRHFEILR